VPKVRIGHPLGESIGFFQSVQNLLVDLILIFIVVGK